MDPSCSSARPPGSHPIRSRARPVPLAACLGASLLPSACTTAGDDGASSVPDPSPWVYEPPDEPTPSLDPEALAAAVQEALALLPSIAAADVRDVYDAVMAGGDDGCPLLYGGSEEGGDYLYWKEYCSSDEGAAFEGYSYDYSFDGLYADAVTWSGWYLYLSATMVDAAGDRLQGAGAVARRRGDSDDGWSYFEQVVDGSFTWSGAGKGGGAWLGGSVQPTLTRTAYLFPEIDGRAMSLEGGLAGLSGALGTIAFSGLSLFSPEFGNACAGEPSGVVSVRDGDGNWYDVVFDGPEAWDEPVDAALCDGCGEVWFRGEAVGDACASFDSLLAWEETPW